MNYIFDCLSFASAPVLVFSFAKFATNFGLFVLRWAFPVVPLLADIARAFGVTILPSVSISGGMVGARWTQA